MKFEIITIFPRIFEGFVSESLLAKAQKKKIISIKTHYLRKWTTDKHQTVDGKPYGGGPGLVMKVEPIYKAVKSLTSNVKRQKSKVILFSPRGKQFDQATAKRWLKYDQLIFICGRYEGVDERVAEHIADEVISIGDYVLNGGEVAAMAVIEAVSRLLPGFMHDSQSASKDDHAQYTKPPVFIPNTGRSKVKSQKSKEWKVPPVLLSGDHKKISEWRAKNR